MWETRVRSLGWEDPLEKGKAAHSSIRAWRIQWTMVHGVAKSRTWLSDFDFTNLSPGREWDIRGHFFLCGVGCRNGRNFQGYTLSSFWSLPFFLPSLLPVWKVKVSITQSCLTLCDPMDRSLPSSSVYGILQARILECIAIPFSRESSWHWDWTWVSCIAGRCFTLEPPWKLACSLNSELLNPAKFAHSSQSLHLLLAQNSCLFSPPPNPVVADSHSSSSPLLGCHHPGESRPCQIYARCSSPHAHSPPLLVTTSYFLLTLCLHHYTRNSPWQIVGSAMEQCSSSLSSSSDALRPEKAPRPTGKPAPFQEHASYFPLHVLYKITPDEALLKRNGCFGYHIQSQCYRRTMLGLHGNNWPTFYKTNTGKIYNAAWIGKSSKQSNREEITFFEVYLVWKTGLQWVVVLFTLV